MRSAVLAFLLSAAMTPIVSARVLRPNMRSKPRAGDLRPFKAPERRRFKLANGLEVVLMEDHRFPLVSARLAVAGGTGQSFGHPGLVNAMAELLTEGTARRGAKAVAEEADSFGGEIGARATKDHVIIKSFSLAEHAGRMFELLAEVAVTPSFPEEEVELRKKNMLEELKLKRSQPDFLGSVAFYRRLFGEHPYGVSAATEESIARIDRDKLKALHGNLFAVGNATLVVVGDIKAGELREMLESRFAAWSSSAGTRARRLAEPQSDPTRPRELLLADRPGSSQSLLLLGNLAITERHEDYFPLLLCNQILGGSFAARLMTELREEKGYTYGVYSGLDTHLSAGVFYVRTQVRTAVTEASLQIILEHLRRMRRSMVGFKELKQAKNMLLGRFVRNMETQAGLADAVLHGLLYELPGDYLDTYMEKVQAVSVMDVRRAAKKYLRPRNLLITVVGDGGMLGESLAGFSSKPVVRVDHDGLPIGKQL